jgi:NADH dehydrogenase FAD-containing subunit
VRAINSTQINSKCFEGMIGAMDKLDRDRRIIVGPHLQVGSYENIFAIGDASAAETTLVGSALAQAVYLADTIGAIEEKREIKDYPLHQNNRAIGVSLGSQDGVVMNPRLNNGIPFDGALAVEHKSRDMSAHFIWTMLNLPTRTEPNWNEKDVVNEDIQALSASMRISVVEARKILIDGLPGMQRAAVDTYT